MEALWKSDYGMYVSAGTAGEKLSVLGKTSSMSVLPAKTGEAGTAGSKRPFDHLSKALSALYTGSIDFRRDGGGSNQER